MKSKVFDVHITGTHGVLIPDTIAQPFRESNQQRVAIKAFFEGNQISFHGKLHYYKNQFQISFGKRYQKQLGVTLQDQFQLQLLKDSSKYGVDMPESLSAVLESDPSAMDFFEALSPGKKRSLIYYVSRFKNVQTQVDKSLIIAENLKRGITDLKEVVKAF